MINELTVGTITELLDVRIIHEGIVIENTFTGEYIILDEQEALLLIKLLSEAMVIRLLQQGWV